MRWPKVGEFGWPSGNSNELRTLAPRGKALTGSVGLSENADLKRWRHETIHLIDSIYSHGYPIKCDIKIRKFNIREKFETNLADTITELEVLIASFEKFGDPNARPTPPRIEPSKPLTAPEKVTMDWIWRNTSTHLWLGAAGLAFAIFSAGTVFGQSVLFAEWATKLKPAMQPASAAHK